MHSTGWVKLDDPDAKITFLAGEALEVFVIFVSRHDTVKVHAGSAG